MTSMKAIEEWIWRLAAWFQAYPDNLWDRQMKADLKSGKLDGLIARAEDDIANRRVRDLDEVLRDD